MLAAKPTLTTAYFNPTGSQLARRQRSVRLPSTLVAKARACTAVVAVRYSCFPIRTCRVDANREPLALPAKLRHCWIRDAVSPCT
jgi:hypothetical protein